MTEKLYIFNDIVSISFDYSTRDLFIEKRFACSDERQETFNIN